MNPNFFIKLLFTFVLISLFFSLVISNAQTFYNNGAQVFSGTGSLVTINGDIQNATGTMDNNGQTMVFGSVINGSTITSSGTIDLTGDWINNSVFNASTGNAIFSGDTQTIGGISSTAFYDLTLQGTGVKKLALNTTVNNIIALNDREIATDIYYLFITNPDTGAITRTTGFVSSSTTGKLSRTTNSTESYLFPTGSSSPTFIYRPVTIKSSVTTSHTYTVRFANADATAEGYNRNTKDSTLCYVNGLWYHRIGRSAGSNPADITFFYDDVADGTFKNVAHWQTFPRWEPLTPVTSVQNPSPAFCTLTLSGWNNFIPEPFALGNDSLGVILTPSSSSYCQGDIPSFTATAGYTNYDFYINSSLGQTGSGNIYSSSSLNTGDTIYAIATDALGCKGKSALFNLVINSVPVANITALDTTSFCVGDSVTLQSSAATSYLWLRNDTSTGITTQNLTVFSTGDYKVLVTNSGGCVDTSAALTVAVNQNPFATVTPPDPDTVCSNELTILQASSGSSWEWLINSSFTGATTQNITVTSSGDYSAVVINAAGCSDTSTAVSITVNPSPTVTITPLDPVDFCTSDSARLQSSSASGNQWLLNGSPTGDTLQNLTVFSAGDFQVAVTNNYGCTDTSGIITVSVSPLPAPVISPPGPLEICAGDSIVLQSSETSGNSWLLNGISSGDTLSAFFITSAGSYSVAVTNAGGCSDTSASVAVTVNPAATAIVIPLDSTSFCSYDSTILQSSSATGNSWLINGTPTGDTLQYLTTSLSGSYQVVVTNSFGCSDTSDGVSVTVFPSPTASISTLDTTTFCEGGSVILQSTSPTGNNWLINDTALGATTPDIETFFSGNYSVVVTNNFGCRDTSGIITVTVNPLPVAAIMSLDTIVFCKGGSVKLQSSSITGNNWLVDGISTGQTGESLTASLSGIFQSVVTNQYGCSDTSNAISVTVNDTPSISAISINSLICSGSDTGSAEASASGGTAPYTYMWNTGITGATLQGLSSGTYSVTVSDYNGCTTAKNVMISETSPIIISSSQEDASCYGFCNGSGSASATGGSPPYTYFWINQQNDTAGTQNIISGLCAGNYSIIVTDTMKCYGSKPITILYPPPVIAGFFADSISGMVPLEVTFTDTSTGANTWQWDFGDGATSMQQHPQHIFSDTGIFTVLLRIVSADGCTDTATLIVRVNPEPVITYFIPNVFSPNNDGNNDMLYVYGNGIEALYLIIYDRWGEKVFETSDVKYGWDGTFRGKQCNPDVYVYYLKIKLTGQSEVKKEGNITLLK